MKRKLATILRALERAFGSPRRTRGDVLDSLVGTILSQSTNSANSSRAFASLKERFPEWPAALKAGARGVERAIRSGGLSKQKSRSIVAVLRRLRGERGELSLEFLRRLGDEEAFSYLVSLPGVGPKTAACVMLFAMGRDVFPVDTHVHRTLTRLGVSGGRTPEGTFRRVSPGVPRGKAMSLHVNLIRLGREFCKVSSSRCEECPVRRLCPSAGKKAPGGKKARLAAVRHAHGGVPRRSKRAAAVAGAAVLLAGCVTPIYDRSSDENERTRCFSLPGVTTISSCDVKEEGKWKKRNRRVSVGGPLFELGSYEGGKYKELSLAKPIFSTGWGELEGLDVRKVSVFPALLYERESEPSGAGRVLTRRRLVVPVALLGVVQDNYGPGYLSVDFPWPFVRYTRGSQRGPEHWEKTWRLLPFYSYERRRHGERETVRAWTLLTDYRRDIEADTVTFKVLWGLIYSYRREGREREYRFLFFKRKKP